VIRGIIVVTITSRKEVTERRIRMAGTKVTAGCGGVLQGCTLGGCGIGASRG
jgi:hypothetical protein